MYLKSLLLAVIYALVGLAVMQLIVPPGFASPVFLPAGIAVASVLALGYRALGGVFLGVLLLNLLVRWLDHTLVSSFVVPSLVITLGATLQAAAGAWLVKRFMGSRPSLDNTRAFLLFALLAGPVACLINATLACTGLVLAGFLPSGQFFQNWSGWWLGDSIGVLIAAPVTLAFVGQPRSVWAPRRLSVAVPMIAATILVSWSIIWVSQWEKQRHNIRFQREAGLLVQGLDARLREQIGSLQAIHSLLSYDPDISRDVFREFTRYWLHSQPSLQALGWSTHVPKGDLSEFQTRIRSSGRPDFSVFDRETANTPAAPGEDILAITYIEPEQKNAAALGVNVLSVDVPRAAVLQAVNTGRVVASGGFRLTQETGNQVGVVVYRAVYSPSDSDDHSVTYQGVVFATLRMQDVIDDATRDFDHRLNACLLDDSDDAPVFRLAGSEGCDQPSLSSSAHFDHTLNFAGRLWRIRIRESEPFGPNLDHRNIWFFTGSSLLAVSLLGMFLLSVSGRTRRIEAVVEQRTRELSAEVEERRAKERALIESENRFRKVFDTASVGLAYCDLNGRILRANPKFCQIVGHSEDELVGLAAQEFTHPDDRPADRQNYANLIAGKVTQVRRRKRYLLPDGNSVPAMVRLSLERDAQGNPIHVVAVVEDLTEQQQLQEAEQARRVAEAANRAKDVFMSRMSHELRTPMNAILGFAQLLGLDEKQKLSPEQTERIGHIQKAGWYLLAMIDDVLDLSRIESGAVQIQPTSVDVNQLAEESLNMMQEQSERAGISTATRLAGDTLYALADGVRLKQVLTNLLSNAIKYNRSGGTVTITTEPHNGQVRIRVSDTGLGMSAEQQASLFEPFNRLGRENSGKEGTGIGLVIARRLVELMNGHISFTSAAGKGSEFMIDLPAAEPPDEAIPEVQEEPASSVDSVEGRVACIEDNLVNAEVVRGLLAQYPGIDLEMHDRGLSGLEAIESAPPDLLLLDINLPDISGIKILERIRSNPKLAELPVVVLSAGAMQAQIEAARAAGANDYLVKPISAARLLELVRHFLEPGDN